MKHDLNTYTKLFTSTPTLKKNTTALRTDNGSEYQHLENLIKITKHQ